MQVGVGRRNKFCENIISVPLQQREIGFPISTDNASWGGTTK
ncbi:hypothetical protein [Staphylococcus aureus]|nr:hypothetical protein [Staphylococcus aureus]